MRFKKKEDSGEAGFDLTPMIDCVFQLLIFFIVCTRFKMDERNLRSFLPDIEGMADSQVPPREQLTVYCDWNDQSGDNRYVIAIGARNRQVVANSQAALADLVILPNDPIGAIRTKKTRYQQLHDALAGAVQDYLTRTGAYIEKVEISFAKDARIGARSGTAPWMFVSTAIDAIAGLNEQRAKDGIPPLPVMFKFTSALNH